MPLTKAQAKSLDILEVARSLGMEMKRKSHREYYWAEHDSFKIDTVKNVWHWYSQADKYGDTISLVQEMRNVSYKEAMVFLETGSFPEAKPMEDVRKPFNYTLVSHERPFVEARAYLKEVRGLSDDTIDFFLEKGTLAQAKRTGKDGVIEDVLVFKYLDRNQQLVGASLQGLVPDQERHPGKGYLKQIMYQSEAISGLNVSIGSPERLIVTEAPIDLMSYYELHKGELNDVRLVAMEGLKEGVLSHYVLEILQDRGEIAMDKRDYTKSSELTRTSRFLSVTAETSTLFQDNKYDALITLAVDRDKAGTDFITKLREKKIPVIDARPPKREGQEKTDWNEILKQTKQLEKAEEIQSSSHFPDTSHLSPEDATWLKENWNNIGFSVESRKQMVIDSDKTVTYEKPSNPLGDGREPKKQIQSTEKAPENSQEQMNDRASGGEGYSQHDAVGSAEPEAELSATFEQTVASHPTSPYRYLHFSTTFEEVQRRQSKYHPITSDDLKRMNQYAGSIQKSSQWYLEELANSKIYYFYSNNGEVSLLDVNFKRENFLHLTGIRPVVPGRNAGDFVVDFAEGRGDYNQILVSNSLKEKLQVIPMLEDILDPKSFVLDNLDEVRIAQRLNFSEAIKSKDEDFLLLFKDIGDERVPASLMKIKRDLRVDVEKTKEKVILGVFRERDGHIEQLSINEDYVKDRGNELQTILKDGLFEEIKPDITKEIEQTTLENTLNSPLLDSATFTQVLDTVYNLGVPGDLSKTPKEFHQAWNQYLDYAKQHNDKFDQIVAAAGEDNLLDTNSDFYKEWKQDHIYKENYHVRLQWAEERPDGPKLPFKETELISYQDFARELYKANQDFYQLHQEGLQQVTGGHPEAYISPTKIQFSIYAPDGELIQDGIRYDIGDEINPIAHKERLGTREMREHPELMKIDGALFNQYHLERLASKQTIENIRDEFEKEQEEEIKLEEQAHNKQELKRDADADGVSDEEELLQGTNPYDFRSKPGSKPEVEEGLQAEEVVLAASSLAVADFIQNKDMAGLSRHLKEGIKEFLDSDKYRDYLTKMSQLNNYSNRNLRLILAQNPEARQVASFKQWKENFGRYVKKGEKALRIFKPMTKIKKGENNQPILDKNGKPETVTFFGLVPVFDVSQTEGKEMPKAAEVKEQLTDLDYANLYRALMAIAKENDVSVRFEEMENNKHGYYSVPENQIVLRSNEMNKAQIIKTFLHEMAHAELHHADNPQKENLTRSTAELQAESVAYVVSSYYGIDTSEYSFNYLSGWSADKETLADLEAQLDIVQQEAKSLMVRMDQALEQLRLSQEKQTKRSFEQKLEKFKGQTQQAVEEHKQELKADAQSKKEKGFSK